LSNQISTKVSKQEMRDINKIIKSGLYINVSDFVRDAVREKLRELKSTKLDSPEIIKERVYEYFKTRGSSGWPDEAAIELGYSVLEVLDALEKLKKEGKAQEAALEVSH
jgi:Arc/MetJ-type ribon-helix-helix transcriptional regulator